jgi:hypothetical protein
MRTTTLSGTAIGVVTLVLGLALGAGSAAAQARADVTPSVAPGPVNCGKITTPRGRTDVIAERTRAGIPGCTEAITVMTEYFQQAPAKAQGTADVLTVRGWRCMTDTGAQGSGWTACDREGLVFHT